MVDPNRWQPLPTPDGVGQRFLVPHWGLVVPFALRAGSELRPGGARRHPGRSYLFQAEELLADSAGLTDEHKAIAEYWADGPGSETPPGHWCLHAQHVSASDGHGLDEDVRLFFALTAALLDAGIACWDAKRAYDSVRPITAIRFLFAGRQVTAWGGPGLGTAEHPGRGLAALPRHPAVRRVPLGPLDLQRRRGRGAGPLHRVRPVRGLGDHPGGRLAGRARGHPGRRVTLSWPTFTDAADQAGRSRRYGGIHFKAGDLVGRALGCMVGARAWQAAADLFAGRHHPGRGRTAA